MTRNRTLVKRCPRCGRLMNATVPGALSRTDNRTEVCPGCGVDEAIQHFAGALDSQETWWAMGGRDR